MTAPLDALLHWRSRERVRELRHTSSVERVEIDAETRALLASLAERIAALEAHATAESELGSVLRSVLGLIAELTMRTGRLEREAQATHDAIATALPTFGAAVVSK